MLPSTCGLALTYHARLLRLRPAGTLPTTLQRSPIFFLTPRKCGISGVCCEALPQQVNYLIDEGMATSKGSDAVISYLHHFFATHGLGETDTVPPLLPLLGCRYNASAIYTTSLIIHQRTCLSCNAESKPSWEEVVQRQCSHQWSAARHDSYLACVQKSTSNVDGVARERRDGVTYSESMQISNFVPQTIKSIYFFDILMHLAIIFALSYRSPMSIDCWISLMARTLDGSALITSAETM